MIGAALWIVSACVVALAAWLALCVVGYVFAQVIMGIEALAAGVVAAGAAIGRGALWIVRRMVGK